MKENKEIVNNEVENLETPITNEEIGVSEPTGIDNATSPQSEEDLQEDVDTFENEDDWLFRK